MNTFKASTQYLRFNTNAGVIAAAVMTAEVSGGSSVGHKLGIRFSDAAAKRLGISSALPAYTGELYEVTKLDKLVFGGAWSLGFVKKLLTSELTDVNKKFEMKPDDIMPYAGTHIDIVTGKEAVQAGLVDQSPDNVLYIVGKGCRAHEFMKALGVPDMMLDKSTVTTYFDNYQVGIAMPTRNVGADKSAAALA